MYVALPPRPPVLGRQPRAASDRQTTRTRSNSRLLAPRAHAACTRVRLWRPRASSALDALRLVLQRERRRERRRARSPATRGAGDDDGDETRRRWGGSSSTPVQSEHTESVHMPPARRTRAPGRARGRAPTSLPAHGRGSRCLAKSVGVRLRIQAAGSAHIPALSPRHVSGNLRVCSVRVKSWFDAAAPYIAFWCISPPFARQRSPAEHEHPHGRRDAAVRARESSTGAVAT